jgi:serine/tyrosine/threonine adenylyltransferase
MQAPQISPTGPTLGQHYAHVHPAFAVPVKPTPVPQPRWVLRNGALATQWGLDPAWLDSDDALRVFAGNALLPGGGPTATVYSGHQFGAWAGQLGDGRALLLGDLKHQGQRTELQLKGAGLTPYSRMGDGRAVLRSSLREYLASEAMHALGVPTTRALALVRSPLPVYREREETAAIVTRSAPSFVRFGHFEHFAHHNMPEALHALIDHVCHDLWPDLGQSLEGDERVAAMLARVAQRSAELVAAWQCMGFCHGVLNTDNMSVLGLTLDYGPFQWMDAHDPGHICNHSDSSGRYAYAQQPTVVHWNLQALAVALSRAVERDQVLADALSVYAPHYAQGLRQTMLRKLGLGALDERAVDLIHRWFDLLAEQGGDHTRSHRALSEALRDTTGDWPEDPPQAVSDALNRPAALNAWWADALVVWRGQAASPAALGATLCGVNPRFVLRNHMAQEAINAAEHGDISVAERLLEVLQTPFETHPNETAWANEVPAWAAGLSVSCSS